MQDMQILSSLLDFFFPPRNPEVLLRGATLESIGAHVRPHAIQANIISLLPYRTPVVRACITEAKFRDSEKAQTLLAAILADYLNEWTSDRTIFETSSIILVPIPLSRARQSERGYNQTERVLQRALPYLSSTQVDNHILVRTRDTLPQTSLSGEARQRNLREAFDVLHIPNPAHTYVVVDDVFTTGATLLTAVDCLRKGGATKVFGLSLAH